MLGVVFLWSVDCAGGRSPVSGGRKWPRGCPPNASPNPCGPGARLGAGQDASEGVRGQGGRGGAPSLALPQIAMTPACMWTTLGLLLLPCVLQEFFLQREPPMLQPLILPAGLTVRQALERVLRLPAVASKRYLTNKVLAASRLYALLPSLHSAQPPATNYLIHCGRGCSRPWESDRSRVAS